MSVCEKGARPPSVENGARRPRKIAKNIQIFTKWSSVGAFGTSPIPKCTVFKTLRCRYRDIAPKPLKLGFKSDFVDHFSRIFSKNLALWIQNRHGHIFGDVYFVRFLRIQLYKITRKLLQNVFCRDSCIFSLWTKSFRGNQNLDPI